MAERGRVILSSISHSTALAELNDPAAILLATWMIPHCDNRGCLQADPRRVRAQVVPLLEWFTVALVADTLQHMEDVGLISRFIQEGRIYLQYNNWRGGTVHWATTIKRISGLRAADNSRRRARAINTPGGDFSLVEWLTLCAIYANRCLCCGAVGELTADHIIPLSIGGSNAIANIQPLCFSCNARKSAKTIDYRSVPHAQAT
jgi:5-methylcytosine-specific restriction endonuclease McrA